MDGHYPYESSAQLESLRKSKKNHDFAVPVSQLVRAFPRDRAGDDRSQAGKITKEIRFRWSLSADRMVLVLVSWSGAHAMKHFFLGILLLASALTLAGC